MPLYRNTSSMPQAAQSAMSGATQAMANQQKQTTTINEKETSFWDDLHKGAQAVGALAGAVNNTAHAVQRGMDIYDEFKFRNAYDNVAKAYEQGGLQAIESNPDMQDIHHARAIGKFMQDRANSKEGYTQMLEKANQAADAMYQDWRTRAIPVAQAYSNGDLEAYNKGMVDLVANSPMPYRLEADGNGNFRELFRSDKDGGWAATGRTITGEQAFQQLHGILSGEQMILRGADMQVVPDNPQFRMGVSRSMLATNATNAENMWDLKKHIPLYDKGGNMAAIGILGSSLKDYGRTQDMTVFGLDGRKLGTYAGGYQGIMQAGLSPYRPQKTAQGRSGQAGQGEGINKAFVKLWQEEGGAIDPKTGKIYDPSGGVVDPAAIRASILKLAGGEK